MPNLFLSYKREDLKAATRLVAALRAESLDVWWDRDIPPAAPWEATIEKALSDAALVLVCWSKAAIGSENVRSEARWAREQDRLIQLFVEPCTPPLFFGERQGVDLSDWTGDRTDPRFRDLLRIVRSKLASSEATAARPTAPAEAARRRKPLKWKWPALVVLAVAILVLAVVGFRVGRLKMLGSAPSADRIAVLPFAALTSGPSAQAFAKGLADQLQGVLNANNMQTISQEDAGALRGPDRDGRIAQLGVRLLLDGDVKEGPTGLQVGIRLDDPRQHLTLWTVDLSGPADQPDALEAEAGGRIVSVLTCAQRALKPDGGLSDPAALSLYLKACNLFVAAPGGAGDLRDDYRLIESLREAVAKAPDFAPARAALAKYLAWYAPRMPVERQAAMRTEAEQQAHRVLAADPKQPDAYLALERLQSWRDYAAREGLLDQALAADPDWPLANDFMAELLIETGRVKASIDYSDHASVFDPFTLASSVFEPLIWTGQSGAGNIQFARFLKLYPHLPPLWLDGLRLYEFEGDWKDYDAQLQDRASWPSGFTQKDAAFWDLLEQAEKIRRPATLAAARRAVMDYPQASSSFKISALARLGFVDDAFALAEDYARNAITIYNNTSFFFSPDTTALRRDKRFMGLAAKLGLVQYWRSTGKWPDFCTEPGLPYDCKAEAAKAAGGSPAKT